MATTATVNRKSRPRPISKVSAQDDFGFLTSREFDQKKYPRRWLIDSVLVDREVGVIGGPRKSLKTHLSLDAAISIGSGRPFLEHFDVPATRRVVVFSGETSPSDVQDAARRICEAKGISLAEDCDVLWPERFPRLGLVKDRNALRNSLRREKAKVVIIDPLYLTLFDGAQADAASNLYAVGVALRKVASACLDAGATPIFVHHTTKGANRTSSSLDLDDLAWAGIAEFARQWLLVNRREAYRADSGKHKLLVAVGGSAGHSGYWRLDVDEGTLKGDFSGRYWDVSVGSWSGGNVDSAQYSHGDMDDDFEREDH